MDSFVTLVFRFVGDHTYTMTLRVDTEEERLKSETRLSEWLDGMGDSVDSYYVQEFHCSQFQIVGLWVILNARFN